MDACERGTPGCTITDGPHRNCWTGKPADVQTILGHKFLPMMREDWAILAGAPDDALICYADDCTVLVYSPGAQEVTKIHQDENPHKCTEKHWKFICEI